MTSTRAIREIVVKYTSEGAEKVRREHDEFAKSGERVEKSSHGVAVATEIVTRRQASAVGSYQKLMAQMDRNFRSQQQLEGAQRTLDRAFQQGVVDQREYARAMDMARQRALTASTANDNLTRSMRSIQGASTALVTNLRNLVGVYASFATLRSLAGLADGWSDLQSRVSNATGSLEAGRETLQRLSEMSARTYSSLTQTTEGWLNQKLALDELGLSTSSQLDLIEALNNAMVISGTRGERAQSVMKAWSDAMATGALRTDGLNTILAGSPRLAEALSVSLGVTVSQLRSMASEGKLTTDSLVGISGQLETLRAEADAMDATLGDAMVRIQNSMLRFVGAADQAGGSTSALATELIKISDWMDANGHVAVAIGDDIARSIQTARQAAEDAVAAYQSMSDVLAEVHAGVNEFVRLTGLAGDEADTFGSAWFDMMASFRTRVADTMLDAVGRISAIPSAGKAAYDVFVDGWRQFPAAIGGIIVEGAAKTLEIIEGMVDGAVGILNYIPGVDITARAAGTASGDLRARFGTDGGEAAKGFVDGFLAEFEANQARVREGFTGLASGIGDALGYETREARQVREAYIAVTEAAAGAWGATKDWLFGTRDEAPATGEAIRSGVTQPTKEAEKALRDAEAARRALFSEADAAVGRFFPFETAIAEAQRLISIVEDTTNGLNDLQRAALRMQADQAFVDLSNKAAKADAAVGGVNGALRTQQDLMLNIASTGFDALFDTSDADNFFDTVMDGFADVGGQLNNDISALFQEDAE